MVFSLLYTESRFSVLEQVPEIASKARCVEDQPVLIRKGFNFL